VTGNQEHRTGDGFRERRIVVRSSVWVVGLAIVVTILSGGCAPQTSVVKIYEDPIRPTNPYERLLIVDVTSDHGLQQLFEDEIAATLQREKIIAIPSHTFLDTRNGVNQDDINRVGDEVGADGILVTHIAAIDTELDVVEGRTELVSTCRRGNPADYFLYDYEQIAEPDSVKIAHTVVVMSSLYDGISHKRKWTIQSTCFEKASTSSALIEAASAIVRQLVIDGFI